MSGTILREIYNLAEGCEEKMETQNEAAKRARSESIAQDNECRVRQPEQEQHMTVGDTQASAEDSDNGDLVMNIHRPLEQRLRHSPKRRAHPYQEYCNRGTNLH